MRQYFVSQDEILEYLDTQARSGDEEYDTFVHIQVLHVKRVRAVRNCAAWRMHIMCDGCKPECWTVKREPRDRALETPVDEESTPVMKW